MADEVKAGEYELLDLTWNEVISKPDALVKRFKRHRQGDVVKLSQEDAERMTRTGSVIPKGERQRRELAAAKARYERALASLPDEVRSSLTATDLVQPTGDGGQDEGSPPNPGETGAGAANEGAQAARTRN